MSSTISNVYALRINIFQLLHYSGRHFHHFQTELGLHTALPKQWTLSIHGSLASLAVTHCSTRLSAFLPPFLTRSPRKV